MDRGDIIAVVIGAVVLLAAVIYVLYFKIKQSEAEDAQAIEEHAQELDAPVFAPPETHFTSDTIEAIHRKYDQMAETDPTLAGKLKYAELLQHHGE